MDRDLAADLAPRLPPTAEIVTADFLEFDPAPLASAGPLRVAGNLPYNLSTPILFKLLRAAAATAGQPTSVASPAIVDATLMLQLEVADRLTARPGTKEYGVLTIFVTAQADVARVLTLPPGAFRPAPKVHSALVRLTFKPPVVPSDLRDVFGRMVRSIFTQRRKTLGNALRPFADAAGVGALQALGEAGIDPARRPETLTLADLVALASALTPPGLQAEP